jgi:hypothetical protein
MVWEYLAERGWVDFGSTVETADAFIGSTATHIGVEGPALTATLDLVHLNAAEASLPGGLREPGLDAPFRLEVAPWVTPFALFASDCGPFWGHDPRDGPKIWDVTLYSGDASKLAWLAETDSVITLAERFVPAVQRLGALYVQFFASSGELFASDPALSERFQDWLPVWPWDPNAFPVRATLWRGKLAVLLGDEEFQSSLFEVYNSLAEGTAMGV